MSGRGKQTGDPTLIHADVGPGLLQQLFGGKSFLHCLIELIKNCMDWHASLILLTTRDRPLLRIVDNGDGMGVDNRNAFLSINRSTAKGPLQTGKFDTGVKHALFSIATHVQVRTVSGEDPDTVYVFAVTTDAYEELVLSKGTLRPECARKTAETWPYEFRIGTEITFTLRDPKSRSILRGAVLAEELAARLPIKFRDIVRVDGEMLPEKEIIGELFQHVVELPHLGSIMFELYQPQAKRNEEDLRFTGVEIGEIPRVNVFRVLPEELRRMVPTVFQIPELCGTISATFLKDYANEDRHTVDPGLGDDPRTPHFIRLLQQFAPEIMRQLAIRIRGADADAEDAAEIKAVMDLFNRRYNPERTPPSDGGVGGTGKGEEHDRGPTDPKKAAFRLSCHKEFEPGEVIEISARFREDLARSYTLEDLAWFTERSRATSVERTASGIRMVAAEIGTGVVRVGLRGHPYSMTVSYEIRRERVFRLSNSHVEIEVGDTLPIMVVNADKLRGPVEWEHSSGPGELRGPGEDGDVSGGRVLYHASGIGHAVVTARDAANPSTRATCDITVVPKREETLCIRGDHFAITEYTAGEQSKRTRPVMMSPGGPVHHIYIRSKGPGYQQALSRGVLAHFLTQAIAAEYPFFAAFELAEHRETTPDSPRTEIDPRDLPTLFDDFRNDGYVILEEILTAPKPTKR